MKTIAMRRGSVMIVKLTGELGSCSRAETGQRAGWVYSRLRPKRTQTGYERAYLDGFQRHRSFDGPI